MERREYLRARRRELLLGTLRLVAVAVLIVGGYLGVRYIFERSTLEVAAVKQRQESDYYLIVDKPVRMTVVDEDGNLSMEITGQEVRLTTDQRTAIFVGADATWYEEGEPSLTMSAGRIEYDTMTEDFLLTEGLEIDTRDGWHVTSPTVEWRRVRDPAKVTGAAPRVPSFRFPEGVEMANRDGNRMRASYMQADKELRYMEFVGNVTGNIAVLRDTGFISERDLAETEELNLEDFESIGFSAEQLIYDMRNQVVLATSRFYDRSFVIHNMDGNVVHIEDYQADPSRVTFSKKEITIEAAHLEAHIERKWASCVGGIQAVVPPAEAEEGDDKALQVVKQYETRIATEEVEYFWGRDYLLTHGATRVEQEDRLALANQITYWGDEKMVLLDGDITVVQGSGQWMVDEELVDVEDHDMRRAVTSYSELYADRAVVYLNNNDFIASGSVRMRQDERETSADTIVYQDEIKRITAQGNVKFEDKDGQRFVCLSMVYHNDSDYMEVEGGAAATIRLPAKYANDINRALAEARELEVPPEIEDPPVSEEVPARNPNLGSAVARAIEPLQPAASQGLPPLDVPGGAAAVPPPAQGEPQELVLQLGEGAEPPAEDGAEPAPPPEDAAEEPR